MKRVILLAAAMFATGCKESEAPKAVPVRADGVLELEVCTFNIRRAHPPDEGDRSWPARIGRVVRTLRRIDADVLGIQEAQHVQAADLRASLPDYEFFGVGRDDGGREGEYAAIFWKRDRFETDPDDRGTFWLSDTPEIAGSSSWGNSVVRAATWVRLIDRPTGRGFYVFNTHFDHRHQGSRERGARLIAERIGARQRTGEPVVLLGDFNAADDNPALRFLTGEAGVAGAPVWDEPLTDAYRRVHPDRRRQCTLHLWRGDDGAPWRIDHILVSDGARLLRARVENEPPPGGPPSDHHPVWAEVAWPE